MFEGNIRKLNEKVLVMFWQEIIYFSTDFFLQ